MKTNREKKTYVQYGSGCEAIKGWLNFDASPTLRIQKIPILGQLLRPKLNCVFDKEILCGDIVKGLPLSSESVDVVFCSHVLEHLSLHDFHVALDNTHRILKRGGIFRCIVPDLELYVKEYINALASNDTRTIASINFIAGTCLGKKERKHGIIAHLSEVYENSSHRWMWDRYSLSKALLDHGFGDIKEFYKGQILDETMILPERGHQFDKGFCLECMKS